jgi:hypothetical protein
MAERKINGREFQVGQVLATEAVMLQARLMQVVGAGVERLPVILKGAGEHASPEDKEASRAAAVAAFTDIFVNGDPKKMTELVSDIVKIATVKRKSGAFEQVDIDLDFTSDKGSLFPVAVFVLQEVLGDFFTGLRGVGNLAKAVQG